jgi:hypothetical protein
MAELLIVDLKDFPGPLHPLKIRCVVHHVHDELFSQ